MSIGTGASAIQLVPAIQPEVDQLHVVQRTPPWVFPHSGRPTTRFERAVYKRFPALQKLVRGAVYAQRETFVLGFVKNPRIMKIAEKIARAKMRKELGDRQDLIEKVTPDYTIGCKRILPRTSGTARSPRTTSSSSPRGSRRSSRSVVFEDGSEREADAIIFSTGFQVTEMPASKLVRDGDG